MINYIRKEFRLCCHITNFLFPLLSLMMLIPNYPYEVCFFYVTLGIFFTCLNARENHDVTFALMLPGSRKDMVKARMLVGFFFELLTILLAIPFCFIRQTFTTLDPETGAVIQMLNESGLEANIALFGVAFFLLGLFNIIFYPKYFKNVNKVGVPFVIGCITFFLVGILLEVLIAVIPALRSALDCFDDIQNFLPKLYVLLAGLVCYVGLSITSVHLAIKNFSKADLN